MECTFMTKCGLCSIKSDLSGVPTPCKVPEIGDPREESVVSSKDYNDAVVLINRAWSSAKVEDARIWALIKGAVLRERNRNFPCDFFRKWKR